jgi:hypothetical protein
VELRVGTRVEVLPLDPNPQSPREVVVGNPWCRGVRRTFFRIQIVVRLNALHRGFSIDSIAGDPCSVGLPCRSAEKE